LHFAGLNVGNASARFGLLACLDSRTEIKPLGQPVHELHDLLSWQVAGLFNNLIQRHRHGFNLPTTEPKLKGEAGNQTPAGVFLAHSLNPRGGQASHRPSRTLAPKLFTTGPNLWLSTKK
jgi:hypothetical protein